MNKIQSKFYLKVIDLYEKKDMPTHVFLGLYNTLLKELSLVKTEEVSLDHIKLIEKSMLFYAEQQDFEKALILKKIIKKYNEIIKERDNLKNNDREAN